MAKPDNRSDNVEHLQEHVQNTIDNLEEAESYLNKHGEEISSHEQQEIEQKNENRKESIQGFREEIKEESAYQQLKE